MRILVQKSLIAVIVALAMTYLFWWPLYGGAGFIGGDLYPYFFPQKAFYADCLKAGSLPLWNDLSGFGYPVFGESQTGAAYPFHLVAYSCLELNSAYNVEHLLHYVICFVATWWFAERLGLARIGACLAAIVFTYGWFPARSCLEWAIVTGAWLPVALWCVESFLQTRLWRYAIGLSVTIGVQMLAGHYHLAFVTQLLVASYAAFRLWIEQHPQSTTITKNETRRPTKRAIVGLMLAVTAGGCLAAIQLLPTWELKQRSSRAVTGGDYDPAYGHLPPWYATQLVAPWHWYSPQSILEINLMRDLAEFAAPWHWYGPSVDRIDSNQPFDLDRAIQQCWFATAGTGTNKVEAHLYCGLIPVCLAFWALIVWIRNIRADTLHKRPRTVIDRTTGYWVCAGVFALVYATGLLLPIGRHVPGFSFFRGPGRYGIVTTLAVALLAGQMLSQLMQRISIRPLAAFLAGIILCSTIGDLWLVSRMVTYTQFVSPPAIAFREASELRRQLLAESQPPRLLAPGANVGNLLGVSCVPWYLGIAPAEYVDPQFAMPIEPKTKESKRPKLANPEMIEWLGHSGVTHILEFDQLDVASWQVELVWKGIDPLLNRVWGRREPIYLYRFRPKYPNTAGEFSGRAYLTEGDGRVTEPDWNRVPAESRRYVLKSDKHRSSTLIVTELAYPGWKARRGETLLEPKTFGMFRSVELPDANGEVVWSYSPLSFYLGAIISVVTLILLAVVAHVRFWHPGVIDRVTQRLI